MTDLFKQLISRNFKNSPKTSIIGLGWIGYSFAEMYVQKGISEFGFLAMLTGVGFILARDEKPKTKDEGNNSNTVG